MTESRPDDETCHARVWQLETLHKTTIKSTNQFQAESGIKISSIPTIERRLYGGIPRQFVNFVAAKYPLGGSRWSLQQLEARNATICAIMARPQQHTNWAGAMRCLPVFFSSPTVEGSEAMVCSLELHPSLSLSCQY